MKKLMLAMIAMAATQSFACPNLEGRWTCVDQSTHQKDTFFIQMPSTAAGKKLRFIYENGFRLDFLANGKPEVVNVGGIPTNSTTTCYEDTISQVASQKVHSPNGDVQSDFTVDFSQSDENTYTETSNGSVAVISGGEKHEVQKMSSLKVCKRANL